MLCQSRHHAYGAALALSASMAASVPAMQYYLAVKWLHRLPQELELSDHDWSMLYLIDRLEGRRESICKECRDMIYNEPRPCWVCGRMYTKDGELAVSSPDDLYKALTEGAEGQPIAPKAARLPEHMRQKIKEAKKFLQGHIKLGAEDS